MNTTQTIPSTQSDTQAKALRYYTMGLNCQEIGKLLDLSARTIERYMQKGQWRQTLHGKTVEERAYELHQAGKSYAEIAKILQVSKGTAYNYLKRYKANLAANDTIKTL